MSLFDQKTPDLTRTLSCRYDRNVALDESFSRVVTLWKFFFLFLSNLSLSSNLFVVLFSVFPLKASSGTAEGEGERLVGPQVHHFFAWV